MNSSGQVGCFPVLRDACEICYLVRLVRATQNQAATGGYYPCKHALGQISSFLFICYSSRAILKPITVHHHFTLPPRLVAPLPTLGLRTRHQPQLPVPPPPSGPSLESLLPDADSPIFAPNVDGKRRPWHGRWTLGQGGIGYGSSPGPSHLHAQLQPQPGLSPPPPPPQGGYLLGPGQPPVNFRGVHCAGCGVCPAHKELHFHGLSFDRSTQPPAATLLCSFPSSAYYFLLCRWSLRFSSGAQPPPCHSDPVGWKM